MRIRIQQLDPDLKLPGRANPGDAGYDLYARIDVRVPPAGGRVAVPTGIAIAIPEGFGGFVQPRSGLALRHGITIVNTPGLIDSGYRNEVGVLLLNTDPHEPFDVKRGERIAQLVIQRVYDIDWDVVESLDDTQRGLGGWGSSGRE